jgi:protein-L-isoaspartate(D-aspartate) O-methyltransferase
MAPELECHKDSEVTVVPFSTSRARQKLIAELRKAGIDDDRVLAAIATVPRERFVPSAAQARAYETVALPIGEDQTISQPYVVARMVQSLRLLGQEHVLEIGTGSGYGAAILAELAGTVITVERNAHLAQHASSLLADLGYSQVNVVVGDGSLGWPELAPYDAIVVTAGSPRVPDALVDQLTEQGRLVAPVGSLHEQRLVLIDQPNRQLAPRDLGPVRFVPLIGAEGFRMVDPSRNN